MWGSPVYGYRSHLGPRKNGSEMAYFRTARAHSVTTAHGAAPKMCTTKLTEIYNNKNPFLLYTPSILLAPQSSAKVGHEALQPTQHEMSRIWTQTNATPEGDWTPNM